MKSSGINLMRRAALAALVALGCSGCVTYDTREATQEKEDLLIVQEDMQRLSGRIEGLELEIQRLQGDVDSLKAGQSRAAQTQGQYLQDSLGECTRRIQALEASREKDKQEIVDRLSRKIADLVRAPAPAKTPQSGKKAAAGYGYEHVVKQGENLSAIAAAYGVKASAILEANDLKDANTLRVGQKLIIPD